jgi:hypothetical protein
MTGTASVARSEAAADLDAAISLSSYGTRQLTALMDFTPCSVSAPAFFAWRAAKIAAVFHAHYPADTPVTEIGCGLGKNLIVLARAGYTSLAGLDPAGSAIRAVREQAAWFGQPWQAGRLDLLDPDPDILQEQLDAGQQVARGRRRAAEVTGRKADGVPVLCWPDEEAEGSRGLWLVEELAVRWGYERGGGQAPTWFEL